MHSVSPNRLKAWREAQGYTQAELGALLGGSDSTTIGRWESERTPIPGWAHLLLGWLIDKRPPFAGTDGPEQDAWNFTLSFAEWAALEKMAIDRGFPTTQDLMRSLAHEALAEREAAQSSKRAAVAASAVVLAEDTTAYNVDGKAKKKPDGNSDQTSGS